MSNAAERRAAKRRSPEAKALAAGVELLNPLLMKAGFTYRLGNSAASSGGPFANGYFTRDEIEIGLIVRNECRLGVPVYTRGHGYANHDRVLAALGLESRSSLTQPDHFTFDARDGGDPFRALHDDFRDLIIPVLERSAADFDKAVDHAVREFQNQLRGKPTANTAAHRTGLRPSDGL